ncbi:MAG: YfaP family protein [Alkalispirochaeta sp.]
MNQWRTSPWWSKVIVVFLVVGFAGCELIPQEEEESGGGGSGTVTTIDPSDSEALTDAITVPAGSEIVEGSLPAVSGSALVSESSGTTLTLDESTITMSNGGQYSIGMSVSGSDPVTGVALQIDGSTRYYMIDQTANANGTLSVPVGLPSNVAGGSFQVNMVVYNAALAVSNGVNLPVTVEQVGAGAIQVQLTWEENSTDLDLYVSEPDGSVIFYGNPSGTGSGGELDVDDRDGGGPENIFYPSVPADGTYQVEVDFYSGPSGYSYAYPTDFTITISTSSGTQQVFTDSFRDVIEDAVRKEVATFTVSGGNVSIQ